MEGTKILRKREAADKPRYSETCRKKTSQLNLSQFGGKRTKGSCEKGKKGNRFEERSETIKKLGPRY